MTTTGAATAAEPIVLLDASDTRMRLIQHAVVYLGIVTLAVSGIVIKKSHGPIPPAGLVGMFVGLALIGATFFLKLGWSVNHRGHAIRFDNDVMRGSRLFIDGRRVAAVGSGDHTRLEGRIESGDGAGDRILVECDAAYLRLRCRIRMEPSIG
jgi:hypothetical protein